MEWAVTPDELRPVTIDDVISPVPMNPSCMGFSCCLETEARTERERPLKRGQTELASILSDDGRGLTFREILGNPSPNLIMEGLSVIRPQSL